MKPFLYGILAGLMCLGLWAIAEKSLNQPSAAEAPQVQDDTMCRAKFANWMMRFEELAKPEREKWESFHGYMGKECVR